MTLPIPIGMGAYVSRLHPNLVHHTTIAKTSNRTSRRRHEMNTRQPVDDAGHLLVAQVLAEVDVQHDAVGSDEDVVVVSVPDAQDVRAHAPAHAAQGEVAHRLNMQLDKEGTRRRSKTIQILQLLGDYFSQPP